MELWDIIVDELTLAAFILPHIMYYVSIRLYYIYWSAIPLIKVSIH